MNNVAVNTPAISIIIPVYNTQDYIERCIRSILCQSFPDFEIVAVDDGSKDASWEVLTRMAATDSRLHIYHKENGGVSAARNMAMMYAQGEWYMFVDSDDELTANALSVLYNAAHGSAYDMVIGNYVRVKEDGTAIHPQRFKEATEWTPDEFIETYFHFAPDQFQGYIWNRLMRASVIREYALQYNASLSYREEGVFQFQYLFRSTRNVRVVPEEVYIYYDRSNSAMGALRHKFVPAHVTNLDARVIILNEIKQYRPTPGNIMMAKQSVNKMARILVSQMIRFRYFDPQMWWRIFMTTARAGALFTNPNK